MNEKTTVEDIAIEQIRPSKTNPRKNFDAVRLTELAESIRTQGIIQPLLVRAGWCMGKTSEEIQKINGDAPAVEFFELVAGERRFRAANIAELTSVPVIVRFLGDQETLEIQLIENLQRDDLDPFEEAEGYKRLLDLRNGAGEPIHTVETIHRRVGKSRKRIWFRLKLLRVATDVRKAVLADGLAVAIAEEIGGLPTPEMRESAAEEIIHPDRDEGPLSARKARDVLATYTRPLSAAPFDPKNADLVEVMEDDQTGERIGGGSCVDCPMRTGNMEAIIGKTKRTDICTNPKCFMAKCDAHFAATQESALKEGKKILTVEECEQIFDPQDCSIEFDSPWVNLAHSPERGEVRDDVHRILPWKKLLEVIEAKPQIAIARDPRGRIVELVNRSLAVEAINLAAKQKGERSIFDRSSRPPSSSRGSSAGTVATGDEPEWKKQERKNREISKFNFQVTLASMTALVAAIDKKGPVKGFWDELIRASIDHAGHDGCWLICKRLGLDPKAENGHTNIEGVQGAALEYGLTLPDEKLKLGYVVELLLSQRVKIYNSGSLGGVREVEAFKGFSKLYGVNVVDVERQVKADAKSEPKKKPEPLAKPAKAAKQATPKAVIVNPTEHQLEEAYSAPEIMRGTIRHPVEIEGKQYTVAAISVGGNVGERPEFDLVELVPAEKFKGKTREYNSESEKKGPNGFFHGIAVKFGGKGYVLGFKTVYRAKREKRVKSPTKKAPKPKKAAVKKVAKKAKKKGGAKK